MQTMDRYRTARHSATVPRVGAVWAQISRAEWLANVGLPLAAAIVSIVVVAIAVKRQMKQAAELAAQDARVARELAAEEASQSRFLQAAQPRAYAAREFAATVLTEIRKLKNADENYWRQNSWPGEEPIQYMIQLVKATVANIGNSPTIDLMRNTVHNIGVIWKWVHDDIVRALDGGMPTSSASLGGDMWTPFAYLEGTARLWLQWDGFAPFPLPADLEEEAKATFGVEGHYGWYEQTAHTARLDLADLIALDAKKRKLEELSRREE